MENAVDNIESLFNKAEADLNLMQTKLDYQFGNIDGTDLQQNPVKLMKKLKDIKDEYAHIAKETAAIQEAQKDFTDFFKSQLMLITESLKALENRTGQSPEEDPKVVQMCDQLSSLLGIPVGELQPFSDPPPVRDSNNSKEEMHTDGACGSTIALSSNVNEFQKTDCKTTEKPDNDAPNLADLRTKGDDFVEVSKEEFLSVSELIRQRVKLEEVNKVYRLLWKFFKEDKNTGMLTPKEMNTMGLRVTGATGQAKLKVLRALKICQINKNGDVGLL